MNLTSLLIAFALTTGVASAATLQLTDAGPGAGSYASNRLGIATDDMIWGVLVDTNDDGFSLSTYATDAVGATIDNGFFAGTDDYLYLGETLTKTVFGSAGAMTQVIVDYDDAAEVGASMDYRLIWFETGTTAGDRFGVSTAQDSLPGSNADNVTPLTFRGDNGSASLTFIPEPSSAALLSLGGLAFFLQRRR